MSFGTPALVRLSVLIVSACALSSILACSASQHGEPKEVHRYEVRGRIVRPIDTSAARRSLWLTHEAIPDFVGINGEVEGMHSMTMSILLDDAVDTSGLVEGAKVQFELSVDWSAPEAGKITAIEILPPETELSFESSD